MNGTKYKRSIVNSLTWRVCATITPVILVWLFTGDLTIVFSVGSIEIIVNLLVIIFMNDFRNSLRGVLTIND